MPYDALYAAREDNILWGDKPGRLVARINELLHHGMVLDAGCGDGKNALYLEQNRFSVVGYDKSKEAMNGLYNRFKRADWEPRGTYEVKDIEKENIGGSFDALVSYGLFHCLAKATRVRIHKALQSGVKDKGYLFFTCLTNELPLPKGHGTGQIELAAEPELNQLLAGWDTIYSECGTIQEEHLPLIGKHMHAATWIIARKR